MLLINIFPPKRGIVAHYGQYGEPITFQLVVIDWPLLQPQLAITEVAYVSLPLEEAYQTAWRVSPSDFRYLVEYGQLPDEEMN